MWQVQGLIEIWLLFKFSDGFWTFGNDGLVNDDNPMPCSDWDGKDMPYLRTIFNFIDAHPSMFDNTKIYAQGFSQNSMFSAYIGFCFNDRVSGIWQGGSGMALTGRISNTYYNSVFCFYFHSRVKFIYTENSVSSLEKLSLAEFRDE